MLSRCSHVMLALLLVLGVVLVGCAKRPATTQATAPAPTGAAATTPGATTAAAQPGGGGTTSSGGTTSGPTTATPAPTATPTNRPAPSEFAAVADLKDIHFDFDKYDIRPGDSKTLDGNAGWLKSNPNHLVLIEGHCDERGTNEYNLALGDRRARATKDFLVAQGVRASRITILSYGEERPVCIEHNEGCWAKNRRAHFLVKPR